MTGCFLNSYGVDGGTFGSPLDVLKGNCTLFVLASRSSAHCRSEIRRCVYSSRPCSPIVYHRARPRIGGALHWLSVFVPPTQLLTNSILGDQSSGWLRVVVLENTAPDYFLASFRSSRPCPHSPKVVVLFVQLKWFVITDEN